MRRKVPNLLFSQAELKRQLNISATQATISLAYAFRAVILRG